MNFGYKLQQNIFFQFLIIVDILILNQMDLANLVTAQQLNQASNQEEVRFRTDMISECLIDLQRRDDKQLKEQITNFLNRLSEINSNQSNSVKSRFYSLLIMNYLTEKNVTNVKKQQKNSKVFSILASHPFLKELKNLALKIDPNKQIQEKGKNYFKHQSHGNDYIRLILELLKYWDSRFPETSKKDKSAYKKQYESLLDKKVIFPNQYVFLTYANASTKRQRQRQSLTKVKVQTSQTPNPAQLMKNVGKSVSIQSQIHYMYGKILNFIQDLDGDLQQVETLISTNHKQFEQELKRFQGMSEQVMTIEDEQISQRYFKIIGFLNAESDFHKQYIVNSTDFQSYITSLKVYAEKQLPQNLNQNTKEIKAKIPKVQSTQFNNKNYNKKTYDSNGLTVKNLSNKQDQSVHRNQPSNPPMNEKVLATVANYFSRLQERSKSPISSGFQKINESLSKEKLITKRTVSPLSKNKNLSKSINSLKESKLASIFTSPPNLYPPSKSYEGMEINQNFALYQQLKSINKSQGLRRFKTANFKGKSSLFENQHLQIGYKSASLYQQINGFKYMIKIQIFFGNLTQQNIKGFTLQFKGDPNVLLYSNPRNIESTIFPSQQNKIQLIIIPIKTPFPLLTMNMRYRAFQTQYQNKIVIPNSIIKLANFMDLSKQELSSRWLYTQIYKTSQFKLCHYLPPQTFTKWIPALGQLTNYNDFANPGSNKDYQLYCLVIMLQKYEALLKISVRPNLKVVIQLGIQDKNEQATSYYKFFLQSLQQFLKEVQ